jgi:hypothetical protein
MGQKRKGGLGRFQPARLAGKEAEAGRRLDLGNMATKGRLRQAKTAGGSREGTAFGNRKEGTRQGPVEI